MKKTLLLLCIVCLYVFSTSAWSMGSSPRAHKVQDRFTAQSALLRTNASIRVVGSSSHLLGMYLEKYGHVLIQTSDGNWTRKITLPNALSKRVTLQITANSTWPVDIEYNGFTTTVRKGHALIFEYNENTWHPLATVQPGGVDGGLYITRNSALRKLNNNPKRLSQHMAYGIPVTLRTTNGNWTRDVRLPRNVPDNNIFALHVDSSWGVHLFLNETTRSYINVRRGEKIRLRYSAYKNTWLPENSVFYVAYGNVHKIKNPRKFSDYFKVYTAVDVTMTNSHYVSYLSLPTSAENGSQFVIRNNSSRSVTVDRIHIGSKWTVTFIKRNGKWSTISHVLRAQ